MTEIKKQLYKNPKAGKVAGVCAGIAEYFGMEVWLVRVIFASAIILTGGPGLPLFCYIVAWFILDNKPEEAIASQESQINVKAKVWQSGEPPRQALQDIVRRYSDLESRLRNLETYVTSRAFSLKREIDRL